VDLAQLWHALPYLALAIALAATTGLRAWLPLLLAAILTRAGWLTLGDSFQFLASDEALLLLLVATLVELVADKIPALDHLLDAISTVIRPAAGSLLAAAALGVVTDPLTATVLGITVGAPASLVPHAAKATLRAASTTLTGGLANPLVSVIEDLGTVGLFVLAVLVPLLVVLAVGTLAFLVLRRLRRRPRVAPAA
jgi:hypothetical protein